MNRRGILLVVSVALIAALWFVTRAFLDWRGRIRQSRYEALRVEFADTLKPGTTRREIEQYLRAHKRPFQQTCCLTAAGDVRLTWTDLIQIGSELPQFGCSYKHIYVALEFDPPGGELSGRDPNDFDKLAKIELFPRSEECL